MNMERTARPLGVPADVRVWRHGDEIPDWIKSQLAGPIAANGTFLIETPLGRQRVHRGFVVIEQEGLLYSCPAARQRAMSEKSQTGERSGPRQLPLWGPANR